MLRDEQRITKLIKKVFENEFKEQEQNLAKIISGNLEITMQDIKSFKNEVNELKKSMEFTQNDLEERVNNTEENMCKVKEDLKEIYEYQVDPNYVNDSLADIRNKLTELEDTAQKMKFSIKGFFSKCYQIRRKLQIWSHLLKKSLMVNFIFCAVRKVEKE